MASSSGKSRPGLPPSNQLRKGSKITTAAYCIKQNALVTSPGTLYGASNFGIIGAYSKPVQWLSSKRAAGFKAANNVGRVHMKGPIAVTLLEVLGRCVYEDRRSLAFRNFFFADCGRGGPSKGGSSVNANGNSGRISSKSADGNVWIDCREVCHLTAASPYLWIRMS